MKDNTARIYLAGPLFTHAEWEWNERFAGSLRDLGIDVILPQRGAEPMLTGKKKFDPELLFKSNLASIDAADAVVAILDGPDADSGTCWECGYAFQSSKPIVGVRTDFRAGGDDPSASINLMLSMSCAQVIAAPLGNRTDVEWLAKCVADAIQQVSRGNAVEAG